MSSIQRFPDIRVLPTISLSYKGPLLPSRGAVFFDYLRSSAQPSAKIDKVLKRIARKCIKMWQNAGLSTTREDNIIRYILDLHDRYNMMNDAYATTTEEFKQKIINFFIKKCNMVFKIGTKKFASLKSIAKQYPQLQNFKKLGNEETKLIKGALKAQQQEQQQGQQQEKEEKRASAGEAGSFHQSIETSNRAPSPSHGDTNNCTQSPPVPEEIHEKLTPQITTPEGQPNDQMVQLLADLLKEQEDSSKLHKILQPVLSSKCEGILLDLLYSAFKHRAEALARLILSEAVSLTKDQRGRDAFNIIIDLDWPEEVKLFTQLGARVRDTDECGCTGLHRAFYNDKSDEMLAVLALELLKEDGISITDNSGLCCLHILCTRDSYVHIVETILSKELEDKDKQVDSIPSQRFAGYTPLHFALSFKQLKIAHLLLDFKVNIKICDATGQSAYQAALQSAQSDERFQEIVTRIERRERLIQR